VLSALQRRLRRAGLRRSDLLLRRECVLPKGSGLLLTQFALWLPWYIVKEVTLSFFGLGATEPRPGWGNPLDAAQRYAVTPAYSLIPAGNRVTRCVSIGVRARNFLSSSGGASLCARHLAAHPAEELLVFWAETGCNGDQLAAKGRAEPQTLDPITAIGVVSGGRVHLCHSEESRPATSRKTGKLNAL